MLKEENHSVESCRPTPPAPDHVCQKGVVLRIEKNGLWVEVQVVSACAGCHAKSVCLSSERRQQEVFAYCDDTKVFSVGEEVQLAMSPKVGYKAVRIGYIYPFLILLASLLIAYRLIDNELLCVVVALASTAVYYLAVWALKKKLNTGFRITAVKKS